MIRKLEFKSIALLLTGLGFVVVNHRFILWTWIHTSSSSQHTSLMSTTKWPNQTLHCRMAATMKKKTMNISEKHQDLNIKINNIQEVSYQRERKRNEIIVEHKRQMEIYEKSHSFSTKAEGNECKKKKKT